MGHVGILWLVCFVVFSGIFLLLSMLAVLLLTVEACSLISVPCSVFTVWRLWEDGHIPWWEVIHRGPFAYLK